MKIWLGAVLPGRRIRENKFQMILAILFLVLLPLSLFVLSFIMEVRNNKVYAYRIRCIDNIMSNTVKLREKPEELKNYMAKSISEFDRVHYYVMWLLFFIPLTWFYKGKDWAA